MKALVFFASMMTFALASVSSVAHADPKNGQVSSLLYNCNLSFHANGQSIYLGIGYSEIYGRGTISCYDFLTGATQHIPIKVKARGPGAGLGVTGLSISGGATGIGLNTEPEALLGRYVVVRGNAAIGIGAAASTGLRLSKDSINLTLNIEAQNGLGAGVDLLFVELNADGERSIQPGPRPTQPEVIERTEVIERPEPVERPAYYYPPVQGPQAEIVYVQENQPVKIVDSQGRVLKVIVVRTQR